MRLLIPTVVVLVLLSLTGCGDDGNPGSSSTGRVSGHVLAGPTCPVERPGDPACEPAPVEGTVRFQQGDRIVATAETADDGRFTREVPLGSYTLSVDAGPGPFPYCEPVEVEVEIAVEVMADIDCDTGIR